MTDKISRYYDKIKFADAKTKKIMIVCERWLECRPPKTLAEIQENGADLISDYDVVEWNLKQNKSEMIHEGDEYDGEDLSGIEEWINAVQKKFNVVEVIDEDKMLQVELDDGEWTEIKAKDIF